MSSDQIKKVAMVVLVLLGLLYAAFTYLIGPLQQQMAVLDRQINELESNIRRANNVIREANDLQVEADEATVIFDQLSSLIPDGAPVAWFPPRVAAFFSRHEIPASTTRFVSRAPLPLDDFEHFAWTIDLPRTDFIPLGIALSGFENEFPLVGITSIEIQSSATEPGLQRVTLGARGVVKP